MMCKKAPTQSIGASICCHSHEGGNLESKLRHLSDLYNSEFLCFSGIKTPHLSSPQGEGLVD